MSNIKNRLIDSYFEKHVLDNPDSNFDYIIRTFILLQSGNTLLGIAINYYKLLSKKNYDVGKIVELILSTIKFNIQNNIDSKLDIIKLIINMNCLDASKIHIKKLELVLNGTDYAKLIVKISNLFKYSNSYIESKPIINIVPQVLSKYITYLDVKPVIFASELTSICETNFNYISSYHFISYILDKDSKDSVTIKFLIDLFERISNLVSYEIISADSIYDQIFIVNYFINVASELYLVGNYHMLFSILSGLNNADVQKIKHLWKSKSYLVTFIKLNDIISFNFNFQNYRNMMKLDSKIVRIPYIGLILSDLIHMLEYSIFDFELGIINADVIQSIYEYMSVIDTYNYKYHYISDPHINHYILNLKINDLDAISTKYIIRNSKIRSQSFDYKLLYKQNSSEVKKNSSAVELSAPRN